MVLKQNKSYYLAIFILTSHLNFAYSIQRKGEIGLPGDRWPCLNEGEEVSPKTNIANMKCFRCICQNGFVECERESCPAVDDCYAVKKAEDGCCDKCKECVFNGNVYQSGDEWSDFDDPCSTFKCIAGVVTESTKKCYTACTNPLQPLLNQCCHSCLGCYLNGQIVHEDRHVTLSEDPCVKCQCKGRRLTCEKQACPVLQCPQTLQYTPEGKCCKKCRKTVTYTSTKGGCLLNGIYYQSHKDKKIRPDACSVCTCFNETAQCQKTTCSALDCPSDNQIIRPGECCPECKPALIEYSTSTCTYKGITYQNNESWKLGACQTCMCNNGEIRCARIQCPIVKCRSNEFLQNIEDQCCPKCIEKSVVCSVFGDPHFRTFDGKFYSFQGACKYQLTADCVTHTFSIRIINDGRIKKHSSYIKTITLKMADIKINLGQRLRVKVNGTKIDSLPYNVDKSVKIFKTLNEELIVETHLGIKIIYDGYNFLQVEAPYTYKQKLCGLCGNYNNVARDDLTTRSGLMVHDNDVKKFAESWRVGGMKACSRKPHDVSHYPQHCINSKKKTIAKCSELKSHHIFENCNTRINSDKYFDFCKLDMCDCLTQSCYCESFTAYAYECERNGVQLLNWRNAANCSQITRENAIRKRKARKGRTKQQNHEKLKLSH
ncbi:hypothetical protein PVAND_003765 [Polypedilum vanderplanki]|uniref:BMP-binding endothelial regulator protein n=1 Tax=Polypedilum vanderplanki TaxID=319348 RepID=A0A9J6BV13_POLVA|nr:hypothetical protein PVAND_003765 [Polypedilum vanderplanki]